MALTISSALLLPVFTLSFWIRCRGLNPAGPFPVPGGCPGWPRDAQQSNPDTETAGGRPRREDAGHWEGYGVF